MTAVDAVLSLPAKWFLAQPDPSEPSTAVAAQVDRQIEQRRDIKRYRQLIIDAVSDYGRSCSEAGAVLSAVRWDVTEDKRQDPLFAYLEVDRFDQDQTEPMEQRLARWQAKVTEAHPDDEVPPRVELVDLDAGRAVRREFVRPVGPHQTLRLVVEFWLPVDGTDSVFNLQFSTSNLAAAATMIPEFDFIARRLVLRSSP
jgi:hypothetical protein